MCNRKVDITVNTKGQSLLNLLGEHSIHTTMLHQERITGVKLNPLGDLISFPIRVGTEISISTFSQGNFLVTGTAREFAYSYFLYYVMNKPNLGLNVVWTILSDETKKELYNLREDQKLFFQMSFSRKTNSYKVLNFGLLKDFTEAATYSFNKRMVKPNLARKFFNLTGGFVEKEQTLTVEDLLKYLSGYDPKVTMVSIAADNFKAPTVEQAIKQNLAMMEHFKIKEGSHASSRYVSPDFSQYFKPEELDHFIQLANISQNFFEQTEKMKPQFKPTRNKIIMFNAPPNAGKDEACRILKAKYPAIFHVNFKDTLYRQSADALGLKKEFWAKVCQDRNLKDEPMLLMPSGKNGAYLSPREVLIHFAEKTLKPAKGEKCIANDTAASIKELTCDLDRPFIVVMPDLGFDYEQSVIKESFPDADVITVRIERPDCTYVGDSRKYMNHFNYRLVNNGSLEQYEKEVIALFDLIMRDEENATHL